MSHPLYWHVSQIRIPPPPLPPPSILLPRIRPPCKTSSTSDHNPTFLFQIKLSACTSCASVCMLACPCNGHCRERTGRGGGFRQPERRKGRAARVRGHQSRPPAGVRRCRAAREHGGRQFGTAGASAPGCTYSRRKCMTRDQLEQYNIYDVSMPTRSSVMALTLADLNLQRRYTSDYAAYDHTHPM